jgi:hypothetical protein
MFHHDATPPDASVRRFSFWKPDPIPPHDQTILPIELCSLGQLEQVAEKLLDVPHMLALPLPPWDPAARSLVNLRWDVEEGVMLQVRVEQGPPKPGEVLTIQAQNAAPEKAFYRLYVQVFEQLGVTVLDEKAHQFVTPREFRTRLAG